MIFVNGNIPWNKGKHLSEQHRKRISIAERTPILTSLRRKKTIEWNKEHTGEKHPKWKGGRYVTKRGYILIHSPDHPFRNNHDRVFEHRLVMEQSLGRFLTKEEAVHHINGVCSDNHLENLKLVNKLLHHKLFHHKRSDETRKKLSQARIKYLASPYTKI
jgi:hypothetical protein